MTVMNRRKMSDEIVRQINAIEASLVMAPEVGEGALAHAMGRRHGLYDIFLWLDKSKAIEFSSDELLEFISKKKDESYKKAFADDDFAALNYEVKKKLDFGKLSSYTAIANHINDRKAKLDPAEE